MKINLNKLNRDYVMARDKFFRQFAGLSSTLTAFKDNTLFLKIETSQRWPKDPFTTALQISQSWREFSELLATATHYRVELHILQSGADTGGVIPNLTDPEAMRAAIEHTKAALRLSERNASKVILTGSIDAPMNPYWSKRSE